MTTHTPDAAWAPLVQSIFLYDGFMPDHAVERVVPTGHVFVLLALDGQPRHLHDTATLAVTATLHDAWVAGAHRDHLSISAHEDSAMLVVQFAPWGTHPFLHLPVDTLADRVVPADRAFDATLVDLHRQVMAADTEAARFAAVDTWLDGRFDPARVPSQPLVEVAQALMAAPAARFAQVVDTWPHSSKHLASQFRRHVGLTPKAFHRLVRFQSILAQVQAGGTPRWSDIAHDTGFADQSHFVREFRAFSGFTPTEFRNLGLDDQLNFFALDREADDRQPGEPGPDRPDGPDR